MAFVSKEWKTRKVEYPGRRVLKNPTTGISTTYDVSRAEGEILQEGDAFSSANMNDLEQRVSNEFGEINKKLSNHFEISEATLSSCTLATAIGLLLANASEKGTYSGRFKCSSGWFTFHCYYANDGGYNSGYVCSISDGTAYTFYCKAGADAVLKKCNGGLKLTGYTFSINVGGISNTPVNSSGRSGSSSLSLDVSEYDSLSIGSYTITGDGDHAAWGPDDHITVTCTVDGTATTIGTGGVTIDVSGASKAVITVGFSDNQSATYGCWAKVTFSEITVE